MGTVFGLFGLSLLLLFMGAPVWVMFIIVLGAGVVIGLVKAQQDRYYYEQQSRDYNRNQPFNHNNERNNFFDE